MRLRSLQLENFRKFDRPVRMYGLSDGLNVLCGPNEFGKSTILAAIRGLLFERHNSRADPIKRMQTGRGNTGPRLAMTFEVGAGLWRLEKRFLHHPMALLTAPGGARFEGEAAEEELQRLLGFGAAGNKGAKAEQMGVWAALWVTQRESVNQADLASGFARTTITSCLDAEVGVLTGSEKGQAIIRAAREQLARLLDGNGKPKGRYKEVIAAIEQSDRNLLGLRDRAQRPTEDSDDLRRTTALLAKESDSKAEADDQATLEDARRRREAALVSEQKLETGRSALALAEKGWSEADAERLARARRSDAIVAAERKLGEAQLVQRDAQGLADETEERRRECRVRLETGESRAAAAINARHHAQRVQAFVERAATLTARERALANAEQEQTHVNALKARLAAMPVDVARIDAIRKATHEAVLAQSGLQAQATEVELDLLPAAVGLVQLGGALCAAGRRTFAVIEDTEIAIAGIGRVYVRPAIKDREKSLKRLAKAEDALRLALAEVGCDNLEEAEIHFTERAAITRDLNEAQANLLHAAPGDEAVGLPPGAAALRDHVDVLRRRIEEDRRALEFETLPAHEIAEAETRQAEQEETKAEEARDRARTDLAAVDDAYSNARVALARVNAEASAADQDLTRLLKDTAHAEAHETSNALALRLAEAWRLLEQSRAEVTHLEGNRSADTPAGMQARIDRCVQALRGRQDNVKKLQLKIAELRTRIAHEGGQGLDEQIAAAEREHEALATEQERHAHEVKVLKLLLDTLSRAELEAKEKYLAPVTRRVTPYLRGLFPGAEIVCDEDFCIAALNRNSVGMEVFEKLSDGTQEQIAVLARLAFAEMLIDQDRPAMVILDDALAYSDAERIERMFDILTQAAAKMQILILTCRDDLFARLGGHRVELEWLDAAVAR